MKRTIIITIAVILAGLAFAPVHTSAAEDNPFIGRWALTIPGGGAGWLGVVQHKGYLEATILWGGGSVVPTDSAFVNEGTLIVNRSRMVRRRDAKGKVIRTDRFPIVLMARLNGDDMDLTIINTSDKGVKTDQFSGKRIPPLPPKPDLSKVKYAKAIELLNGKNKDGWRLTNPGQVDGWSVKDGLLVNNPVQKKGQPHVSYGNLRTDAEFEDFNLTLEVNVPKGGNSGVYLRGIYESQVADTFGRKLDSHNMGGIYSRITPSVAAEKPAGEWQTMDLTLCDRHVTVILNGTTIIDNEPLLGCTGGAMTSDEFKPGPIYLQGDHDAVSYRNIILKPIVK